MALIQIPARRIRRDFNPDFPVVPRVDLFGEPRLLCVPQTGGNRIYMPGSVTALENNSAATYPSYTRATPAGPAYYMTPQQSGAPLCARSNYVFGAGLSGITILIAYRVTKTGLPPGWRELMGAKSNQVVECWHASDNSVGMIYGANSITYSLPGSQQAGKTYRSAWSSGTQGSSIWMDGALIGTNAMENAALSGMNNTTVHLGWGYDYTAPAEFLLIAVMPYQMRASQIQAWMADPFGSLLRPANDAVWVPVAGGGGSGAVLVGAAVSTATAAGNLITAIPLSGSAASLAIANGDLTAQIRLSGAALAAALATGDLTIEINLNGAAVAQAVATGYMQLPGALAGAAVAIATAAGDIQTQIPLTGVAAAIVSADGSLATPIAFTGAAVSVTTALGSLDTKITLDGAALAQAAATGALGSLLVNISLSGAAVARAWVNGYFAGGVYKPALPSRARGVYAENRRAKALFENRRAAA